MADPTTFLNSRVTLHAGDCLAVLPTLAENSVDSVVTDPPYHLTSIVKRFGKAGAAEAQFGTDGAYRRASAGFMGKAWDGGDVAFNPATWTAVLRVMKPGAHLIAFGGTRTYHRLAIAVEDAGFEIRDAIMWHYGSGFPKSHDVSKGIDKRLKAKGSFGVPKSAAHAGWINRGRMRGKDNQEGWQRPWMDDPDQVENAARRYISGSNEGYEWEGWGTALKPATEILVLARKPLTGTVAENVLKHGVGAINIDGCRVGSDGGTAGAGAGAGAIVFSNELNGTFGKPVPGLGRWPANVILSDDEEVQSAFPDVHGAGAAGYDKERAEYNASAYSATDGKMFRVGDPGGSAARFFYTSKADSEDRAGSRHPTVKPLDLMQYLVRLITPPRGLILDPFAGSGTTGEAAWREGFSAILIEREAEYIQDIERRMALCLAGPDERARESIKAKLKGKPEDHGPLFSTSSLFDEAAE